MKTRLHKKQQNCNKLLTLFSMSIALLSGVVAMGISTIRESYHQAKAVSYDDDNLAITLSVDELNNYSFVNFNNTVLGFLNDGDGLEDFLIEIYSNELDETFTWVSTDIQDDVVYFTYNYTDYDIYFSEGNAYHFSFNSNEFSSFISLTFYDTYYEDFKQAIEQDIAANQPNPSQPMLDFVSIIVSGIGAFASGVASGVSDFASALFLKVEGGQVVGLSVFGGILAIFCGLALAVGITIKVYNWITTLGN